MGVSHTGPVFQRPVFQPLAADDPAAVSGYRISARLGAGAGAGARHGSEVYLAHAPGGLPVALRVFPPGPFPYDAQALRRVHGPYTVPVVDSGTDGPRPWLASAYVPGLSLHTAVTLAGPLPVPSVLRLVAGVAEALRTIHHAGVVHGDLRPSHVLLAADGPRVKDFGVARLTEAAPPAPPPAAVRPNAPATEGFARLTEGVPSTSPPAAGRPNAPAADGFARLTEAAPPAPPPIAGRPNVPATEGFARLTEGAPSTSPPAAVSSNVPAADGFARVTEAAPPSSADGFASPEAAAGRPSVPATDVFALGLIAAYASTGAAPFGDGPAGAAQPRVLQAEPDLSELPGELREIVTRCLIKDPALRPSPSQVIAMCAQAAPDASRRRADRWLPPALLAAIVPAMPPPAPPVPAVPPVAGHPGALHYGWARPPAVPFPRYLPVHLPRRRPSAGRRVSTVVAAVGALAVVATAGVALAGGFHDGDGGGRPAAAAPSARADAPRTPSPTDTGRGGDATGVPEPSEGSLYQGVRLPAGYGLSLVEDPLVVRAGTLSGVFGFTPQADAFATSVNRGTLALLAPQLPSTLAGCGAATHEVASIPRRLVTPGTRVCVRSMDGTMALLTIRTLTPPTTPTQAATLDALVWRITDQSAEANQ